MPTSNRSASRGMIPSASCRKLPGGYAKLADYVEELVGMLRGWWQSAITEKGLDELASAVAGVQFRQ